MSLAASFRCVLKLVLDGFRFLDFFWWLVGPRFFLRPFGLKCTQLEPAPHNHVGSTDASKGRNCHGEPANIVENEPPGDHFFTRTQGATLMLEKIYHHWNQFHKTTSGQQILPRATAPMGNMMGPAANTNTTRLGTQA